MLKIAEIPFVSCQGEGIHSGKPMCFVRLTGCNLRCIWCDTKYALMQGTDMTEMEIWRRICELPVTNWICITGGEPMLQNLEELIYLIQEESKYCKSITIETNGTLEPKGRWLNQIDLLTISPKMTNSGMRDRWKTKSIANLLWRRERLTQLKFVCECTDDILEAIGLVNTLADMFSSARMHRIPIVIQPQGTVHTLLQLYRELWEFVSKSSFTYDIRVLPQLHRLLYGSRRGV